MDMSFAEYNPHRTRTYPRTRYPSTQTYASNPFPYVPAPPSPIKQYSLDSVDSGTQHPLGSEWSPTWETQIITYTSVRGYTQASPHRHSPPPFKRPRNTGEAEEEVVVENTMEATWTRAPIPFSSVPKVSPRPFIPDVSFSDRSQRTSFDTDSDAGSTSSTLIEPTLPAFSFEKRSNKPSRSASRNSNVDKSLPPPPPPEPVATTTNESPDTLPPHIATRAIVELPGDLSSNFVFAAPKSRAKPPVIIRTHSQSLTVFGGLKAIWKKATAHVRQVKRNGLLAVVTPVDPRDSALWNGFAPVTPPGAEGSERRSGIWWMSGRNAIAENPQPPAQQDGVEMQTRPPAARMRTASSNTSAETFVTAPEFSPP
ncbi:hypothetical protein FRB94_006579 [Tulasnella sp. JGI-2019a]|nr:hypothetical protein FRB94_006579 [Tulasnella sp. JGI-2019a]